MLPDNRVLQSQKYFVSRVDRKCCYRLFYKSKDFKSQDVLAPLAETKTISETQRYCTYCIIVVV